METLTTALIICLTLYALGRHYYNSLTSDTSDSCGCGGCSGNCGGNCNQHDPEQTTTDTTQENSKSTPVKPAQLSFN